MAKGDAAPPTGTPLQLCVRDGAGNTTIYPAVALVAHDKGEVDVAFYRLGASTWGEAPRVSADDSGGRFWRRVPSK